MFWIQVFIRYLIYKCFLPLCKLSFNFFDGIVNSSSFKFILMLCSSYFCLSLVLLKLYLRKPSLIQDHED